MNGRIFALVVVLSIISGIRQFLGAQQWGMREVVRIITDKSAGGMGEDIGAGLIIGREADQLFLLTAFHVVETGYPVKVELYRTEGRYSASVLQQDESLDMAVLSIKAVPDLDFPFLIPAEVDAGPARGLLNPSVGSWLWHTHRFNLIGAGLLALLSILVIPGARRRMSRFQRRRSTGTAT